MAISRIALEGLPHSEIFGSKPVCGSPKLIAAYHVLHRRPAPRHPPYALSSLTTAFTLLENAVVFVRLSLRAFKNKDLRLSMIRGLESVPQRRPVGTPPLGPPRREGRALASARPLARPPTDRPTWASRGRGWWSWPGSNRRPPGCKPGALPAELQPRSCGWWA